MRKMANSLHNKKRVHKKYRLISLKQIIIKWSDNWLEMNLHKNKFNVRVEKAVGKVWGLTKQQLFACLQ